MIADLSYQTIGLVWLGAFAGGIATGAAGFGFAVVAASIWLHVLDPLHTTALIVSAGTVVQAGLTWRMRQAIEPARLWPFLIGAAVGVPLGVYLLASVNRPALKAALGSFLVLYGLYALLAPRLPYVRAGRGADSVIGFIGGVLGGIGGYSGVIPTIWTQLRGWSREMARAVYQPFIFLVNGCVLVLVGIVGFDWKAVVLFALTLPMLIFGAYVGWKIYGRLDERRFRQMIGAMLAVSGALLVI